jgi:hypothetical protein
LFIILASLYRDHPGPCFLRFGKGNSKNAILQFGRDMLNVDPHRQTHRSCKLADLHLVQQNPCLLRELIGLALGLDRQNVVFECDLQFFLLRRAPPPR